jgi:ArsR family transcriptional regulator
MERGTLLDVLGNETRREILQMLSQAPCYISQIAQELEIGHKAVIEHLEIMREAGILEASVRKIQKGRPRKYYRIRRDFTLEVRVSQRRYNVRTITPRREPKAALASPELRKIARDLEEARRWRGKKRETALLGILAAIQEEEKRLLGERRYLQYLRELVFQERERGDHPAEGELPVSS